MLDIGFTELTIIAVVALIVIGPERLPRVARTVGHLLGRFQRYVSEVKSDINREIELSELKDIRASVEDAARSIESTVKSEMHSVEEGLRSAEAQLDGAGEALREAQDDINRGLAPFSTPHLGMGTASEPDAAQPDPAGGGQVAGEGNPGDDAAAADQPSPQLELGLASGAPPAPEPAAPKQA